MEHIFPQTVDDDKLLKELITSYDTEVYNRGLENSLGNFTILSKAQNAAVSNHNLTIKINFYKYLTAESPEAISTLETKLNKELNSEKDLMKLLSGSEYISGSGDNYHFNFEKFNQRTPTQYMLKDVTSKVEWSDQTIRERGRRIGERVWDLLFPIFDR